MTLNLMLTSRSAVYLSGDFRLTPLHPSGGASLPVDDLAVQKLVPTFKYGWSALVAFTGVAVYPRHMPDLGEWIVQRLESIPKSARFEALPAALLTADEWLGKIQGTRQLAFSVVGFVGRKPFAMLISNFLTLSGMAVNPERPQLQREDGKPRRPSVFVAGDRTAVTPEEVEKLLSLLQRNRRPVDVWTEMAEINAAAAGRSSYISRECVTGVLLPTGQAEIVPHGIGAGAGVISDREVVHRQVW